MRGRASVLVLSAAFGLVPVFCGTAFASEPFLLTVEADYDPAVPTPESAIGHPPGTALTDYSQLERYLGALVGVPTVRVTRYGHSLERRPLFLLVISSPENLERLEEIRDRIGKLADPRLLSGAGEAERLVRETPAVAWLNYANDGNETAAFEAALVVAHHLAADRSPASQALRRDLVIVLTPCLNPESHERMVAWYRAFAQEEGNPDPRAYEHHAPWGMSTNYNHYQIDLNRDATFGTQPETRAFAAQYLRWNPQVFVDHHGETRSYFFPPFAAPLNANMGNALSGWLRIYGDALAESFAGRGWTFFSRESFDDFYPGYWDAFPSLSGAVGMTYETDGGGDDGLRLEGPDGSVRTLEAATLRHVHRSPCGAGSWPGGTPCARSSRSTICCSRPQSPSPLSPWAASTPSTGPSIPGTGSAGPASPTPSTSPASPPPPAPPASRLQACPSAFRSSAAASPISPCCRSLLPSSRRDRGCRSDRRLSDTDNDAGSQSRKGGTKRKWRAHVLVDERPHWHQLSGDGDE